MGRNPFSERSPLHDAERIDMNVLSELYLFRESWNGSDFAVSNHVVGLHRGVLRPERFLFMSQRAYSSLAQEVRRDLRIEIAHLVDT